ncbi:MAG: YciI family protein [Actinomycetota bacterium]|nr:YciI family protein [Actinomycetota bacterium]
MCSWDKARDEARSIGTTSCPHPAFWDRATDYWGDTSEHERLRFQAQRSRATFALDMTDEEREITGRHAHYWQPLIDSGQMVVFGPVLDGTGSWGLGVVEADDEDELRAFAAGDPAVISGTANIEVGKMLAGFVRPRSVE